MDWHRDTLPTIVRAMAARPRHEALRGHVAELLREHFGAQFEELSHEAYLLEGRGRIGASQAASATSVLRPGTFLTWAALARISTTSPSERICQTGFH